MMPRLPEPHLGAHPNSTEGYHVLRRSDMYWVGLSTDLVIEQVSMRTHVGLTRGNGIIENQRFVGRIVHASMCKHQWHHSKVERCLSWNLWPVQGYYLNERDTFVQNNYYLTFPMHDSSTKSQCGESKRDRSKYIVQSMVGTSTSTGLIMQIMMLKFAVIQTAVPSARHKDTILIGDDTYLLK